MARSPRSRPLLCIDVAADSLHATFLPKGREEPRVSGLLPAAATPVELGQGELGWRVGHIAFARRLIDAPGTLMGVCGLLVRSVAENAQVSTDASLPHAEQAAALHESFELPVAHLLAHATRRALGEEEPALAAADEETDEAPEVDPIEEAAQGDAIAGEDDGQPEPPVDDPAIEPEAEAGDDDDEASLMHEQAHPEPEPLSATAKALMEAEALLLVGGHLDESAQAALSRASELAGLPAPAILLREEAVAHATYRLALSEAHARQVREEMAKDAALAAQTRALVADNEAPRTEAQDAAALEGEQEPSEMAENATTDEDAEADELDTTSIEPVGVDETSSQPPPADESVEAAEAPEPTPDSATQAPRAWLQVALHADGLEVSRVEVGESGPRILQRAFTAQASVAAIAARAFAWAQGAWQQQAGELSIDALAERRLADAAEKAFRRLSASDPKEATPKVTTLSLPAMALSPVEPGEPATLVGLEATLSRKDALALLEPVLAMAIGTIDDVVPPASAPHSGGKSRKKKTSPAADDEGLLITGDIDAWPGLREALAARLPTRRILSGPSPEGIANAARALLDGTDAMAA